jgi:hypothetical protein
VKETIMAIPAPFSMEKKMPRLTIDLSEGKHKEINLLRDVGEVGTIKELVNYALTLLKWAMVERSKGHKICSVRQEGGETVMQELEMPVLAAASKHLGFADAVEPANAAARY